MATLWGDNLFEFVPEATVQRFASHPSACMITVAMTDAPQHFSTVSIEHGRVISVTDKPAQPATNTACTGLMLFESRLSSSRSGQSHRIHGGERTSCALFVSL